MQEYMKSEREKSFYFTSSNSTNVKFTHELSLSMNENAVDVVILDRDTTCDESSSCSCIVYFKHDPNPTITLNCTHFDEDNLEKWPRSVSRSRSENYAVELILANCNITSLYPVYKYVPEVRERLTKLVLSGNSLQNLNELEGDLPALEVLELDRNQFKTLQLSDIERLKRWKNLKNITLGENPWTCGCHMEDFRNFIHNHKKLISDVDKVICSNNNKPILKLAYRDEGFCPFDYLPMIAIGISFAMLAFIGIASMYFFHVYEKEIKVWIFSKPCLRFLVTEKELDRHLPFDAFISYASQDEKFVVDELVPELECGERPYKLCIHQRDWHGGDYIPTQIHRSVEQSRRTIIVLSPNFLNSFWGKKEFQVAYLKSMKERCSRILIILYEDIGDMNNLDKEMKAYISTNTYLEWKDPKFWQKLKYSLPHTYRIRCKRTREELLIP